LRFIQVGGVEVSGSFWVAGVALVGAALLSGPSVAASFENNNFDPEQDAGWQMPSADLFAVSVKGDRALAVGYWGTILLSVDRGKTWIYRPSPTSRTLFGVDFADPQHAWAVGDAGIVLRSSDGGETWEKVTVEVEDPDGLRGELDAVLFDVAAVDNVVWASGDFGALIQSTDGGKNWTRYYLPEEVFGDGFLPDRLFNGIEFQDTQRGWIAGEFGTALRTEDGGATWTNRETIEGAISDIYLFGLGVNGELDGVAGGVGGVSLVTSDGGKTWQAVKVPTTAGLFGAAAKGSRALLVGDRGEIVASRDAGKTWFKPKRPKLFNWLQGAVFGDDGLVLVVGEGNLVLRSEDGGDSFERVLGRDLQPLSAISVPMPGRSTEAGRTEDLIERY